MSRKLPGSAIVSGSITVTQISGGLNDTTNAAYAQANTARDTGNNAYTQANTARSDANTTFATINTTFGTVNTSLGTINTNYQAAYSQANTARDTGNNAYASANLAYTQANNARSDANTTFATVNTTFGTINTSLSTINSSFGTTNTNYQAAYAQANTARDTANNAYNNSNTKLSTSGGSISGDLAITGNLTVQGNATTINVTNLSVNDSMILLATGGAGDSNDIGFIGHIQRGATDTHIGLIRKATENRFYLFDNYEVEPTNNVIDVAGNNFRVGNLRLGIVNANSYVTSAGMDVTGQANAAYSQANAAYGQANTARDTANNAYGSANLAYAQANTARSDANTTFATINTTFATINTTTATMNTATTNRVLKAGDTMTGNLIVSGATINTSTANISTIVTGNNLTLSTGAASNGNIVFSSNGTEDMRIVANGWVGIGTTNPTTKLQVGNVGDGAQSGIYVPGAFNFDGAYLQQATTGGRGAALTLAAHVNSTNSTAFRFSADNDAAQGNLIISYAGATTTYSGLSFSEKLRIDGINGRVGIGTNNPITTLHVHGTQPVRLTGTNAGSAGIINIVGGMEFYKDATPTYAYSVAMHATGGSTTNDLIFTSYSGSWTERVRFTNTGNVGIGTTDPIATTQIRRSSNGTALLIQNSTGGTGSYVDLDFGTYGNEIASYANSAATIRATDDGAYSAHITFRTKGAAVNAAQTERLRITSAGNVGIGTTNPPNALTVVGKIESRGNASDANYAAFLSGIYDSSHTLQLGVKINSGTESEVFGVYADGGGGNPRAILNPSNGWKVGIGTTSIDYAKMQIREAGITAAAISTGWPAYNAETATQSKYVLHLDAGGNGSVVAQGQGPSATLLLGNYYDSRGIITMLGAGGGSPSDQGNGYGKDLMVKAGNSDNGNGLIGGRLFLAGGSGFSGGAFGSNYGPVVLQSQGGNVGVGNGGPTFKLDISEAGAVISGTATTGSNMKGIRIYNTTTATTNNAIGLWMATGPHQAGIASFRADAASTWDTCLAFYTHVNATSNLNDATEKMRIHGEGYVTKPNQPAFSVYQQGSASKNGILTYTDSILNRGSCVNLTNGRFTAPVSGAYQISFMGFQDSGSTGVLEIFFYKNGASTGVRAYHNDADGAYGPHQTLSTVLSLTAGDYVTVYVVQGSIHGNMDGYFSGFLIG